MSVALTASTSTVLSSPTIHSTATYARARHAGSGQVSDAAIAIAAVAVLVLLATAAWAFAKSRAYEPRWLLSVRHSSAEAGYRASAVWSEFQDWVRLGR
jgi:hypothetical protein